MQEEEKFQNTDFSLWKIISIGAIISSMCCLPSVVLVMFGLASISTAAALSDSLYWGIGRPIFFLLTGIFVALGLIFHFRKLGICTIDEAQRNKKKIINTTLLVGTLTIVAYLIINFVILEIIGLWLGLPWEDSAFWL